jgi:lipopolysaccharide transport system ATP-binding protein
MAETIITVENLSKRYLVGHRTAKRERYTALRDVIGREAHNFTRKAIDLFRGRQIVQGDDVEEFWALKDINFEIKQGEVVGIIGRNGAGKSTLLKILSRITEPTEGRAVLRGRTASLLEVGTGFHPELTGRENIFLNGAILGMTRGEIRKKFDEIVSFSEVERFLDMPVKHYSSGMYVRLAFAVAAHLEPEILVVDEVLAVGDAKFQEKCIAKIGDVATGGRTVLFVSHNTSAILQLTGRAIVLSQGRVDFAGSSAEAVKKYIDAGQNVRPIEFDVRNAKRRWPGTGEVRILTLRFDRSQSRFEFSSPIRYIVRVRAEHAVERIRVAMAVFAADGSPVGLCFSPDVAGLTAGTECEFVVELAPVRLAPGRYFCNISVGRGNHRTTNLDYDIVTDTLFFEVAPETTELGSIASWSFGWGSISFPDLEIERSERSKNTLADVVGTERIGVGGRAEELQSITSATPVDKSRSD